MLRMSLVLYCTLDCLHDGRILINSHYVRGVNVINSNVVVSWYPKDMLRYFERRGRECFEWSNTAAENRRAFLAHNPFLRPKEKHQQNWAIFFNLQKGSCAQFIWFVNYFSWPNESCYLPAEKLPHPADIADTNHKKKKKSISCCEIPVVVSSLSGTGCPVTPTLLKRRNWSKEIQTQVSISEGPLVQMVL